MWHTSKGRTRFITAEATLGDLALRVFENEWDYAEVLREALARVLVGWFDPTDPRAAQPREAARDGGRCSRDQLGTAGHIGGLGALVGTVLAAGGAWDSLFALPYLADEAPALLDEPTGGTLLAGFIVSYLVLAAGWIVFAVASWRAGTTPRGAAIVLILGGVFAILPSPTAIRLLPLALGCALAGRAILRERRAVQD